MAAVDAKQLELWIKEVHSVCPHVPKDAIKQDLIKTKSAEQTINRIFDGAIDLVTNADEALTDEIPEDAYDDSIKTQVIISPNNKNRDELVALALAVAESSRSTSKPLAGVAKVQPKSKAKFAAPRVVSAPKISITPKIPPIATYVDDETLINKAIRESLLDSPSPIRPIVAVPTTTTTPKQRGRKPKTSTIQVPEPRDTNQPAITSLMTPQKSPSVDTSINVSYNLDELLGKYSGTPLRSDKSFNLNDSNASDMLMPTSMGDYDMVYLDDEKHSASPFPRMYTSPPSARPPVTQSTPSVPNHTQTRLTKSSSAIPEFILDDDDDEIPLKRNGRTNTARKLALPQGPEMDLDDSVIDLTDNVNIEKLVQSAMAKSRVNPSTMAIDNDDIEPFEINDSQEDVIMAVDYDEDPTSRRNNNNNGGNNSNNVNRANGGYFDYVPDEMGVEDYENYNNALNNFDDNCGSNNNNTQLKLSTTSLKKSIESTKSATSEAPTATAATKKKSAGTKSKEKSPNGKAGKKKNDKQALEELTVLIDRRLLEQAGGADVLSFLQKNNCKTQIQDLKLANTILWRRKTKNEETEQEEEYEEKFLLVKVTATDLATLISKDMLIKHYDMLKTSYVGYRITYLIEGLDAYLKDSVKEKSASMRNIVLSMSDSQVPSATAVTNKKKKEDSERRLMRKDFDEALLVLQIEKGCSVRKTYDANETADTVYRFTSSIAQIPYKKQEPAFETFCAESALGGRKSAKTIYEAWIAQLEQINSVSKQIAEAIAKKFPTLRSLVNMYLSTGMTEREKKLLLAELRIESFGAPGRKVGPAISEKVYRVFVETNGAAKIN